MAAIDEISEYIEMFKGPMGQIFSNHNVILNELKLELLKYQKLLTHLHIAHAHPCCHTYNGEISTKKYNDPLFIKCEDKYNNSNFYPDDKLSPTELLLKEASIQMDCDNNKLVFLKHFLFIKAMQRIELKRNVIIPRYNWSDYLKIG